MQNRKSFPLFAALVFVASLGYASSPSSQGFDSSTTMQPYWWWDHHRIECSPWAYAGTEYTCKHIPFGECADIVGYDCLTRIRIEIRTRHCVKYDENGNVIEEYDEIDSGDRYRDGCCGICVQNVVPRAFLDNGLHHLKQYSVCVDSRYK